MVKEFADFAEESSLLTSGIFDFYGDNSLLFGNYSNLGLANENYKVTRLQLDKILALINDFISVGMVKILVMP